MNRPVSEKMVVFAVVCVLTGWRTGEADPGESTRPPVAVIHWAEHPRSDELSGEIVPAGVDGPARLRLVHSHPEPRQFALVEFAPPPIADSTYAIRGRVRYSGVTGQGYLELLNHFPGKGVFFTRTLSEGGPMGRIEGTSDWRDFQLPFHQGTLHGPEKLVMNLSLAGPGTVEITDLELHVPADWATAGSSWWSDRIGGLIGGLGGAFLGIFLGGCLAPLAQRGKARRFVTASLIGTTFVCSVILLIGLVALALRQPYNVYFPLLLLGGLGSSLSLVQLRTVQRKYRDSELQRIAALDAV